MWISFRICSQEALLRAVLSRFPHFAVDQNHPGSLSKRSPGPTPNLMYQNLGGVGPRHLYFKSWWFCPQPHPPTPVFLPGKSHGQRSWWSIVHEITRVRHHLVINHNCTPILAPTPSTALWPLILEPVQRNLISLPLHVALLKNKREICGAPTLCRFLWFNEELLVDPGGSISILREGPLHLWATKQWTPSDFWFNQEANLKKSGFLTSSYLETIFKFTTGKTGIIKELPDSKIH